MLFQKGRYPLPPIIRHTEIDGMDDNGYDKCHRGDELHLPGDAFRDTKLLILNIMLHFWFVRRVSLSRNYEVLDVQPIFSQLTWRWIHFSKRWFQSFPHTVMGLVGHGHVKIIPVVSRPCTDDRMRLTHPTIHKKRNLCPVELSPWRGNWHARRPCLNFSDSQFVITLNLLFSMSSEVRFQSNRNKGIKDESNIRRFWSNRWLDAFDSQIYCPFLLVARISFTMCVIWFAKCEENRCFKWQL